MREIFAGVFVATLLGCSSGNGPPTAPVVLDGGASDAASHATFGASACGRCVTRACSTAIRACDDTPDCQSYLACLDGCPVARDGNAITSCASDCRKPSSSAGQAAASQFDACRATGAGASCTSCGAASPGGDAGSVDGGSSDDGSSDDGSPDDGNGADVNDTDADGGDLLHETCPSDVDAANGCARCIRERCCDARNACLGDPSCFALSDCEANCQAGEPDEAGATAEPPDGGGAYSCDLWCGAETNSGLGEWARLLTCSNNLCQGASQCGGGDTCTMCLTKHCANEDIALSATPDGYLFNDCIDQCATTDTACQSQCQNDYPSVATALDAYVTCADQECPSCE